MAKKSLSPWQFGNLGRWDDAGAPWNTMRSEMEAFQRRMERMFEDFGGGNWPSWQSESASGDIMPSLNQSEDDKAYHVSLELPGMSDKDVDVSYADGMLTVRGEKKEETEEKDEKRDYFRRERRFGSFRRTVPVPGEIDDTKIAASFKNGVLDIKLPKSKESRQKVKQIDVKST